MLESLRGVGYTTAAALADIVDNSIAARAKNVDISFAWTGAASTIAILDDGIGMSDPELELAMRLGARNPDEERSPHDLGRFGLGLKTAALSQCRRLTVASRKNGHTSCLRWDLDKLSEGEGDGWYLLEGPSEDGEDYLEPVQQGDSGTLVLWQVLDRIVTPGYTHQDFLDLIDKVEQHLALVFHRYLQDAKNRILIRINGLELKGWDPFLISHPATWSSPVERIPSPGGAVTVQCHVLPHKDRLSPAEQFAGGGPDGWTAQQGFYIYRNQRLLACGTWLGLGRGRAWTKEEAHRLARIRLDIPNTADAEWKIDIRKSAARPPVAIRERLTRLAEDTRDRARRVFAHRGQAVRPGTVEPAVPAWRAEHFNGGIRYRIEENHPAIRSVLDEAGQLGPQIRAMLRILEETIPIQRIWLDTAESMETPRTGFAGAPPDAVLAVLAVVYRTLVTRKGLAPAAARQQLLGTEPFNAHPDLVAALPDDPGTTP